MGGARPRSLFRRRAATAARGRARARTETGHPLIPAEAGIQPRLIGKRGPRFRGDERIVQACEDRDADLIVLPGSKATIADLAALRSAGFDIDIAAHRRRGGLVLGLCGGYQMLGRTIADPAGIEGPPATVDGLGLIDVTTTLSDTK